MQWYWFGAYFALVLFVAAGFSFLVGLACQLRVPFCSPKFGRYAAFIISCGFVIWSAVDTISIRLDRTDPWTDGLIETARWMKQNLPPKELAASYASGILGYHSGMDVVNLDGLINSPKYLAYLKEANSLKYLQQVQASYYVQHNTREVRDPIVAGVPNEAVFRLAKSNGSETVTFTIYRLKWLQQAP